MTRRRAPLIVGNWKMNGLRANLNEVQVLASLIEKTAPREAIVICPPATLLNALSVACKAVGILTGGQDCHASAAGAHTGDISAEMLFDAGARFCIIGHSERRQAYRDTDADVLAKARAAMRARLTPIVCVGETLDDRTGGRAASVVATQLSNSLPEEARHLDVVIAYEPVWAIGSGMTPQLDDIRSMHFAIRSQLICRFGDRGGAIPILYGGSLKPANARDILAIPNVDGGLVGGASLDARALFAIAVVSSKRAGRLQEAKDRML